MKKQEGALTVILGLIIFLPLEGAIVYSGIQDILVPEHSDADIFLTFGTANDSFRVHDQRGGFGVIRQPTRPIEGESYATLLYPEGMVLGVGFETPIQMNEDWSQIVTGIPLLGYSESHPWFGAGDYYDQENKYMPLRIFDDDDALYGWVRMSHSLADEQLVIHDWAWNSVPGEPILAGEIPEPQTVALLAGIAALAAAGGRRILRKRLMHTA